MAILACPVDKGPLFYLGDEGGLYNPRLRRRYAIRDGIPVMLPDESEVVAEADAVALDARITAGELAPTFVA